MLLLGVISLYSTNFYATHWSTTLNRI